MKRVWRTISRCELLFDYILFNVLTLISGGLLVAQIAKIAGKAALTVSNTRFTMFFIAALLTVVLLTGFSLYKKSVAYIVWYKEIFNAIPMPLIVTGEEAEWLQVNKATREAVNLKGKRNLENLNSRHLVNADGSVMSRTWFHNGKNYQVAGKPLRCGGKYAGYLIFLSDAPEALESVKIHTEMLGKVHKHIKYISAETEYLRGCANNISDHMIWQSGIITDLLGIIDGFTSGEMVDPQVLNERIYAIKADMQCHTKNSQAELEKMRQITTEWKAAHASVGGSLCQDETA